MFEAITKHPSLSIYYVVIGRNRNVRLHGKDRYAPFSKRQKQYYLDANVCNNAACVLNAASNQKYDNTQQTKPTRYFMKRKRRNRGPKGQKYVRVGINYLMCA